MKFLPALLLAFVSFQDSDLEEARRNERERIRTRPPLAEAARSACTPVRGFEAESRDPVLKRTVDVVFIDFADRKWEDADWGEKTFEPVKSFYRAQSDKSFALSMVDRGGASSKTKRVEWARWPGGSRRLKAELADLYRRAGAEGADVIFVVPGGPGRRESALWPHSDLLEIKGREVRYVLTVGDLGGYEVGALAHEIGHLFDLPDKYEDPDVSAGPWCLMGTGYLGQRNDKTHTPNPMCADCRARLGWITVHTLDARKPHQVVLDSVEKTKKVLRVPLNRNDTESLLLECRDGKGLLVWHLEDGKTTAFIGRFPKRSSVRLTPYSEPAFRGRSLGAWRIFLTDIRFEKGRVWLRIAPKARLTKLEELRRSSMGKRLGER